MDHAEARELLELAAVEPGGLDRLMAGDTAEAALVAGHLAGCPSCTDELVRLRRDATLIRGLVRAMPPVDLRERTLAHVRALGRDRTSRGPDRGEPEAAEPGVAAAAGATSTETLPGRRGTRASRTRWLGAIAAVLALAVIATALVVRAERDAALTALDAELQRRATTVAALERVAAKSLEVAARSDAEYVSLSATAADDPSGTLVFSASSGDLVVVARGLEDPGEGREFRCWFEVDGERRPVGRMFFADDLSFWAGPVDGLDTLGAEGRFGVTLVDAEGSSLDGDPVLSSAR